MKAKKLKIEVKTLYGVFKVTLEPEPDMGGYIITVPKKSDVISWGKNLTHAKRMVKEAIECSIEGDILIAAEKEKAIEKFLKL